MLYPPFIAIMNNSYATVLLSHIRLSSDHSMTAVDLQKSSLKATFSCSSNCSCSVFTHLLRSCTCLKLCSLKSFSTNLSCYLVFFLGNALPLLHDQYIFGMRVQHVVNNSRPRNAQYSSGHIDYSRIDMYLSAHRVLAD